MKYALTVIIVVLAGAIGFWFYFDGNPFEKGLPAPSTVTQVEEVKLKLSDLSNRIDTLALEHEREFGKLHGKLVELESQLDASQPEGQEGSKSLSEDVLELKTQLDSARFRLSQLEELMESYQAANLAMQEKLTENQNQLEALKEELVKFKPRKEAAGEHPKPGAEEEPSAGSPDSPAAGRHNKDTGE
jgi:hypothetical protein